MATVLCVDDEPGMQVLYPDVLGCMGVNVVVARNGVEALGLYRAHHPDIALVISDFHMPPGMDGLQVYEALRREYRCGMPPFVLASCGGRTQMDELRQRVSEAGAFFFRKTVWHRSAGRNCTASVETRQRNFLSFKFSIPVNQD